MEKLLRSLTVKIIVGIIMPCTFYTASPVGEAPINPYKSDLERRLTLLRSIPQALRDQRDKTRTYFLELKSKREDLRKEIKKALEDYKKSMNLVREQIKTIQKELLGPDGIIQKFKDNAKVTDEVELADKLTTDTLQQDVRDAENSLNNFSNLDVPKEIVQ